MPAVIRDKALLDVVNLEVNEGIEYVDDVTQWHEPDRWEDGWDTRKEDCEGFAIAKIRKLLALGWPKADLRLAIVGIETPGDHGVACARDQDGQWWVLDNRFPFVMAPEEVGYTWVEWGIGNQWTTVSLTEART